ncbi:MAG: hypothetical protein Q8P20_09550 [bacterium]|nr:hypothetical protein [bacterium]
MTKKEKKALIASLGLILDIDDIELIKLMVESIIENLKDSIL